MACPINAIMHHLLFAFFAFFGSCFPSSKVSFIERCQTVNVQSLNAIKHYDFKSIATVANPTGGRKVVLRNLKIIDKSGVILFQVIGEESLYLSCVEEAQPHHGPMWRCGNTRRLRVSCVAGRLIIAQFPHSKSTVIFPQQNIT